VLVPPVSIDAVIREAQRNANANASAGVFGAAGAGGHGRCVNPFSGAWSDAGNCSTENSNYLLLQKTFILLNKK
jgi:hypothetical protein